MSDIPIGIGPVEWVWEAGQISVLATTAQVRVVTDTWAAMTGGGPQWLKGVANILFNETSAGTGQLSVTTPPYPDSPLESEAQYVVGSGLYLATGGDQTVLTVWLSTNGFFFFREGGVPSGEDFGDNYTVTDGDRIAFHFSMPMTDPAPL